MVGGFVVETGGGGAVVIGGSGNPVVVMGRFVIGSGSPVVVMGRFVIGSSALVSEDIMSPKPVVVGGPAVGPSVSVGVKIGVGVGVNIGVGVGWGSVVWPSPDVRLSSTDETASPSPLVVVTGCGVSIGVGSAFGVGVNVGVGVGFGSSAGSAILDVGPLPVVGSFVITVSTPTMMPAVVVGLRAVFKSEATEPITVASASPKPPLLLVVGSATTGGFNVVPLVSACRFTTRGK